MMLARISGKDGNLYFPGGHGMVPGHIVAPAPATVKIGVVSTDSQKLQVSWTWESSALENMKSEVASAKPVELPLEMDGSCARKQAVANQPSRPAKLFWVTTGWISKIVISLRFSLNRHVI